MIIIISFILHVSCYKIKICIFVLYVIHEYILFFFVEEIHEYIVESFLLLSFSSLKPNLTSFELYTYHIIASKNQHLHEGSIIECTCAKKCPHMHVIHRHKVMYSQFFFIALCLFFYIKNLGELILNASIYLVDTNIYL